MVSRTFGTTARSGWSKNLAGNIVFGASRVQDSDYDGLPDDIEFAIGTSPFDDDTDGNGVSDFAEIDNGLDPLGGRSQTVGPVGSVALGISPLALTVANDIAYCAGLREDGTAELVLVDVSDFGNPIILSRVGLLGEPRAVGVEPVLRRAVVTTSFTTSVIDVRDPREAALIHSIPVPSDDLEVFEGIVYLIDNHGGIDARDVETGLEIGTVLIDLPGTGRMTRSGKRLYVRSEDKLHKLDISEPEALRVISRPVEAVTPRVLDMTTDGEGLYVIGQADGIPQPSILHVYDIAGRELPEDVGPIPDMGLLYENMALNGSGLILMDGRTQRADVTGSLNYISVSNRSSPRFIQSLAINEELTVRDLATAKGFGVRGHGWRPKRGGRTRGGELSSLRHRGPGS